MKYLIVSLVLLTQIGFANIGVFSGDGFSLEFQKNNNIALLNEEVIVTPTRGEVLFNGTFDGMDKVKYKCKFTLKNKNKNSIRVRVAFPLNSDQVKLKEQMPKSKMELISFYNFIAQDKYQIFDVKYKKETKSKEYKNLFIWDIDFNPNETKEVYISYSMPISMNVISAGLKLSYNSSYKKDWYVLLQRSIIEYFGYVTKTALTWSDDTKSAFFKINSKHFEEYLKNRPFMEISSQSLVEKTMRKFASWNSPAIFRDIIGFNFEDSNNSLVYRTTKAEDFQKGFIVRYYILNLPRDVYSLESLIESLRLKGFNTKEDIEDLTDILKEFNSIKTNNKNIKTFLENQVWYKKETQFKIPDEVFDYLDNL